MHANVYFRRQEYFECSSFTKLAVNGNETAVAFDDSNGCRKSETGAFAKFLCGKERIEDFLDCRSRHPLAGVLHAKRHINATFRLRRPRTVMPIHSQAF